MASQVSSVSVDAAAAGSLCSRRVLQPAHAEQSLGLVRSQVVMIVLLLAPAACSSEGDGSTSTAGTTTSTATSTTTLSASIVLDPAGCPVRDEAFCVVAAEAANALAAREAGQLLELSRSGTINCVEVAREYFPGCESQEVIDGYGLSGPDLLVELVTRDAFAVRLEAITGSVDPSFSDQHGDGGVRVVGVGTCGPDEPGRRTYHLAWTAALIERGRPAMRMLGSFEWVFDDDWRIVLTYLGTLEAWEAAQTNPLDDAFCAAGRAPWRA
jgi:hypothetical protein